MRKFTVYCFLFIGLISFSNAQEVFYRAKQNGGNFGIGFSNSRNSSSSFINISYVFSGKFIMFAEFERASTHNSEVPVLRGNASGVGVGLISRKDKLPFDARLLLFYNSIKIENYSEIDFNQYALSFSLYKNLNPEKPVNIIPEIFLNYSIISASYEGSRRSSTYTSDGFSYGFFMNFGYITSTTFSPLFALGAILNSSEAIFAFKVSIAISKFRK